MTTAPRAPAYGRAALSDLLPSVGAHVLRGTDAATGVEDVFGLPEARRYVVMLIDGLGWDVWPALVVAADARPIDACAPSTTVTSLTSLGTGLPPGQHGLAGYSFRHGGKIFSPLRWPRAVSADDVQPRLTFMERLAQARVDVTMIAADEFEGSGLTKAAFRGARFLGVPDERDLGAVATAASECVQAETAVGYVYHRALDHAGHAAGLNSAEWLAELRRAGELVRRVRDSLPGDAVLIVTGDHGLVSVPEDARVVIEETPALARGVAQVGGEARFRHLYTDDADAVAHRWTEALGDRVWVRTRDEAIDAGWFGDVAPMLRPRWGDVLVAAREPFGMLSTAFPKEWALRGMHGSLTDAELSVPLAVL